MKVLLIEQLGRLERGPEFVAAVLAAGESDGVAVRVDAERFNRLLKEYPRQWRGLGDMVAAMAKPIAGALGIEDCGACDKRQEWLNEKVPFKSVANDSH